MSTEILDLADLCHAGRGDIVGKTGWANVARVVCPTEEWFEAVVEVQMRDTLFSACPCGPVG